MSAQSVSSGTKRCCNCGKNVAGQKRMKDSQGRYWCVPCGQADQRKKGGGGGGSAGQTTCAGCGGTFPARKMQEYTRQSYCKRCFNRVTGGSGFSLAGLFSGGGGGGSEEDSAKKRKKIVIAVVAVLVLGLVSLVINYGIPGADDGDEPAIPEYADPNYGKKK